MRRAIFLTAALLATSCSQPDAPASHPGESVPAAASPTAAPSGDAAATEHGSPAITPQPAAPKGLSDEQQAKLLGARVDVPYQKTFSDVAKALLVSTRVQLPHGVGLTAASKEIGDATLQFPFPNFYKPTLRELLDAIARQTSSEWKYDPDGKSGSHDTPDDKRKRPAIFEFQKSDRARSFEIDAAAGWKASDEGLSLLFSPPGIFGALEIREMGSYSLDDKSKEKELLDEVRREVSLDSALSKRHSVDASELTHAKVGPFDALFFTTKIMTEGFPKQHATWRQWAFMVDNKCYLVTSTILQINESKELSDVEKMLASFKIKKE